MTTGEKEIIEENVKSNSIEKGVKNWLEIETFISMISSRFIGDFEFNDAINGSLRDIGILSNVDRSFLFIFDREKSTMSNTHEWCADGINSQKRYLKNLKLNSFPWLGDHIKQGKIASINNISNLPEKAKSIKELFIICKYNSFLISPIYIKKEVTGFIGLSNISIIEEWKQKQVSLLRILSLIIGTFLEQRNVKYLLKESEEKYRLILENINDLIIIIDFKFKLEYINERSFFKSLGYQSKEVIGFSLLNFIHPNDIERVVNQLQEGFKREEFLIEFRLRCKDGKKLWFECKGHSYKDKNRINKCLVILRNITDRKLAERKYKVLFENSPNAIFLIDLNGLVIDVNSTVKKLFQLDKTYFLGKNIDTLNEIFPFEVKCYFKKIFKAFLKNDFPEPLEIQICIKETDLIWVLIQASVMKQENKTLIQLIFQDISEKKKAEILERKFKEKLEIEVKKRTEELHNTLDQQNLYLDQILKSSQFKTEFMATMSHELRTPLNAIIGFADLLLEGDYGTLNNEQKEFIEDIRSSAHHQYDMIKQILDISKIESGQMVLNIQKFSLNSIVEQILSSFKPLIQNKRIEIIVKGLDSEIKICADPIRFKEIVLNLVSNAIKFTIEGKIIFKFVDSYNQWIFSVSDTGIGIATDDFSIIFKEFKRVDSTYVRSVPGTGLGLSLTKRLVELHQGTISFSSLEGAGSIFTFILPKDLEKKIK